MIIAVDGPAASGKGTISRGLADHFGLPYLDSGLLYRGVGFELLSELKAPHMTDALVEKAERVAQNLDVSKLDPIVLGAPDVALAAAKVARIPRVRKALFGLQRDFAMQEGGAIIDGRDIGSRICPEADAKLFVTASPDVRARRRTDQLVSQGIKVTQADILEQIVQRDENDRANPAGAFFPADNALLLDTSELDIEASLRQAIALVERATKSGMN